MTKIAINGFGRIGRLLLSQVLENPEIAVVAINDLGNLENLAYLYSHDSTYGELKGLASAGASHTLQIGGTDQKSIPVFQERDPSKLPWARIGVDIVVEATGAFESFEASRAHLGAGAKRVIIAAPANDSDSDDAKTILLGVNEEETASCLLTSHGSCTTNAASPVMQILEEEIGVAKAMLNTVHGYTATQNLVDGPPRGKDFRRGRAAAVNIVPSSTGAAVSVTRAIKSLAGKFDGIALRVPVLTGSIADITLVAKRKTTVEEVNAILTKAAEAPRWRGIMKVTTEQLVSSDIIREPYGAIVDLGLTRVVDGDLVKVLSWYDNEWGYVATLIKHIEIIAKNIQSHS